MTFNLENDLISIKVNAVGAELISLKIKENDLEFLWEADPEVWARHAPILFPIVGKLKDNTYNYNGIKYSLPQHGFARDKEFKLIGQDAQSITLQLQSDSETLLHYPFSFLLTISYFLEANKVLVNHKIQNLKGTDMYFSIGAHPGFRCPLLNENFQDYFLEFEQEESFIRHKIKESLLSGTQEPVPANGKIISLTRDLFKEDALVFKNLKSKYVSLKNKINDHKVTVSLSDFPYLGIWTKIMDKATFVCIEPWLGIADNFDFEGDLTQKEGIIHLKGQQEYTCSYNISIK